MPPRTQRTGENFAVDFWNRLGVGTVPDGCEPWTGCRSAAGYGIIQREGRTMRAHRVAWALAYGPIPDGLNVLHRCDNPPCCNPTHLWLGTHADNMRDRGAKGRTASGDRSGARLHPDGLARGDRNGARAHPERLARGDHSGARLHPASVPRGERHGKAKLSKSKVIEIRERARLGETHRSIADAYGISKSNVGMILTGKTWSHVSGGGDDAG